MLSFGVSSRGVRKKTVDFFLLSGYSVSMLFSIVNFPFIATKSSLSF